jgi:DNA-binding XRE family transcriptional regulator
VDYSEAIVKVRLALGKQLAAYRDAAGLTQHKLAPLIHYGRSTIANAESGRQTCSRTFWVRSDKALNTNGELIRAYEDLKTLERRQRQELAQGLAVKREIMYLEPSREPITGGDREDFFALDPETILDDVRRRSSLAPLSIYSTAARPLRHRHRRRPQTPQQGDFHPALPRH